MRLKRSGFSLVLSLTIMAAMVMMVIVLASFLQVESRLAQSHSGYLRARFNALASARIAIGQLQQLAGPDQRVTMRADMYADNDKPVGSNNADTTGPVRGRPDRANNNAPTGGKLSHQKRYLTGVWATGGVDPTRVRDWDVTNPADSRLFLGWIASPFDVNASPELSGTPTNYVPNSDYFATDSNGRRIVVAARLAEAQAYIDDLGNAISTVPSEIVPLVSYGSVNLPAGLSGLERNYMGAVDALTASWRLTKGSKVDLFVFGLVVGMLNLAGVLLCGLGLVVTIPLSGLASMMVYDNLRVVGPKEV
jgi:hypothetical protein